MAALGAGSALLTCPGLAEAQARAAVPMRKLSQESPEILIKSVTTFDVLVPQSSPSSLPPSPGTPGRINVTRVETNSGLMGYSFLGSTAEQVAAAQSVLVGKDLFQIEVHLKNGLMEWGAIEEAMWDAIGKVAGEPVSRLLGGASLPNVPV